MALTSSHILLCTDLDRTLLPNGQQNESPEARPTLRHLASRPEVFLAYVSGRRLDLHLEAMQAYDVPEPDYIVADVGASIYHLEGATWKLDARWFAKLSESWQGRGWRDVLPLLSDIDGLVLQPEEAQAPYKLSFHVPTPSCRDRIMREVEARLAASNIRSELIWSVDETIGLGLLDIMAEGATKLDAVEWLISLTQVPRDRVIYAGDSGNDLPVLTSGIRSVLVANATDEVRKEAIEGNRQSGHNDALYIARGGYRDMNGNYSAGIVEGVLHFFPEAHDWLISA